MKKIIIVVLSLVVLFGGNVNVKAQSKRTVIWLGIDGLSSNLMSEFKASGVELPHLDALRAIGSEITGVSIPRPAYGGANASVLTGNSPEKNGSNVRYYDHDSEQFINEEIKMRQDTVFNMVDKSQAVDHTFAMGWRVGTTSLTQHEKLEGFALPKSDRFSYVDVPSGDNSLSGIEQIVDSLISELDQNGGNTQLLSAFSNDLLHSGWSHVASFDKLKQQIQHIDTQLGRLMDKLESLKLLETTTWMIHGVSDIHFGYRKVESSQLLKDIAEVTGKTVQIIDGKTSFSSDIGLIKQYRQGYGQLYFNKSLSSLDRDAVIEKLNAGSLDYLKKAVSPIEVGAPSVAADLVLWPEDRISFSAASSENIRVDDLNNPFAYTLIAGLGFPVGQDSSNEVKSLMDITPNVLNVLDISVPINLEGKVWSYKDAVETKPSLKIEQPISESVIVYNEILTIEGGVDKVSKVSINGEFIDVDAEGKFKENYPLDLGLNEITILAENHVGSDTYTIRAEYRGTPQSRGGNTVVYINWDGFAQYYLDEAISSGRSIPTLKNVISEGVSFSNAYTSIPSITNAMQPIVVTGTTPKFTNNHYRYFDKNTLSAIQENPPRKNRAETIAESLARQNLSLLSINQFALEDRGAFVNDPEHLYVSASQGSGLERFDYATEFLRTRKAGGFEYDALPKFIVLYMDDLDGLGHNEKPTYGFELAKTEKERMENVMQGLELLDTKLGEFITEAKNQGVYQDMSFILTTDHGMAQYGRQEEGDHGYKTSLPDLKATIESLGSDFKTEILLANETIKDSDTDIAIISVGLQAQISHINTRDSEVIEQRNQAIIAAVSSKEYYETHIGPDHIRERGLKDDFADLIISPKPPYNFKTGDIDAIRDARGQHDSLSSSAQNIVLLMWGQGIKTGKQVDSVVYSTSAAATISQLLGVSAPLDATASVLSEALTGESAVYDKETLIMSTTELKIPDNASYFDFYYISDTDKILDLYLDDRLIREVFFPKNENGNQPKRINLDSKGGSTILFKEDTRNLTSFKIQSVDIFGVFERVSPGENPSEEPEDEPPVHPDIERPGNEEVGKLPATGLSKFERGLPAFLVMIGLGAVILSEWSKKRAKKH